MSTRFRVMRVWRGIWEIERQTQNQAKMNRATRDDIRDRGNEVVDCTLEMRQPGWAHFAGKGLQSEAKAILTEVPADGC